MIALRIFAFLALAYSVQGGADLELVYKLLDCCKRAILDGVPTVPVPSHNPLLIPHNVSFNGATFGADFNATLANIVWYGIPDWELKVGKQLSEDTDAHAVFDFDIYWKSFNMSMDYSLQYHVGFVEQNSHGQIILNWTHTDWVGTINFTKPGFGLKEEVSSLDLTWTVKDIDTHVTGLGLLDAGAGALISTTLTNYLNHVLGTGLSPLLIGRLNDFWLANSTRVPILFDWCDSNQ
ncbi:unnamed protein product [Phaedon cochleariae]|uniref:Uncharacterized protein n=1 Tax=Phaedon cochleariae TaxID=80249 RepID=A0A9N9X6X9_PHACE|nr:unnamed protein product [Phaedon cochleariae]